MHPNSLKSSYEYHLNAFDRAMKAGIEDVGGGVHLDYQILNLRFYH